MEKHDALLGPRDRGFAAMIWTSWEREAWGEEMRWTLACARKTLGDAFETTVLPFLATFNDVWEETPLAKVRTADDLARWAQLAPFARFAVDIRSPDEYASFAASPFLAQVIELSNARCGGSMGAPEYAEGLDALARAPLTGIRKLTLEGLSETALEILNNSSHASNAWEWSISINLATSFPKNPHLRHLKNISVYGAENEENLSTCPFRNEIRNLAWTRPQDLDSVIANPLPKLESIDLGVLAGKDPQDLARVLNAHATSLTSLKFGSCGLAKEMALSLPKLERLNLSCGYLGKGPLFESTLPALRELELSVMQVDAKDLMASPLFRTVTTLRLGADTKLKQKGLASLIAAPELDSIEHLSLRATLNRNTPPKLKWSSLKRIPRKLRILDLAQCNLTELQIKELAESPLLGQIEELILDGNRMWSNGVLELSRSPHLGNLRILRLRGCTLGTDGAKALALASMPSLVSLDLSSCGLKDDELSALCESELLKEIRYLDVSENKLGNAGIAALAQSPYLANLEKLLVNKSEIGPSGARALAEANWPRIAFLHLHPSWVDNEAHPLLHDAENLPAAFRAAFADWDALLS